MPPTISVRPISPEEIVLLDGNREGVELLSIRANIDGEFVVSMRPGATLDVGSLQSDPRKQSKHSHVARKSPNGIKRNWKVEGHKLVVWSLGKTKAEVELDISPLPGEHTPSGVPEIYGQHELLFEVAMALSLGQNALLSGPTGTGKTTILAWLAEKLNRNLVSMSVTPKTEAAHMLGEYLPGPAAGEFPFIYGPVSQAVMESQKHPTILVFDELSRIGNIAEMAGILPLLDHQKKLEIPSHPGADGKPEVLIPGNLFIAATMNPADSDDEIGAGDYIGVTELDPALASRFTFHPPVAYPPKAIEAAALVDRVPGLDTDTANKMVDAANRIRSSAEIRFPVSFRELEGWALAIPFLGYARAAHIAVTRKANPAFRRDIDNLLLLQG